MSRSFLTAEDIDEKENNISFREKKRSFSLNNLNNITSIPDDDVVIQAEKSNFSTTSHSGNKFKGLKKKLNIKLSKSNTDLAAHNVKDGKKFDISSLKNSTANVKHSPRDGRKQTSKDHCKRSKTEMNTMNDSSDQASSSNSRLSLDSIPNATHIQAAYDLADNQISESSINYEYVDELGATYEHDDNDGAVLPDQQIEKLWRKIEKIREDLVQLQSIRDDNVSEYLKTTDSNDAISNAKIKVNFERNNQKTNASIHLLQKKLEKYLQQVKEIEERGGVHGTKKIMKVVQDSMRSGASSITGAVSKPLESFNNFIKKEKKISSTENVYITVTNEDETERGYQSTYTTSDDENLSSSYSNLVRDGVFENIRKRMVAHEETELDVLRSMVEKLEKEGEESKQNMNQFKDRLNWVMKSLQDESYKTEQLQIRLNDLFNQWNDLTELHQNEMMGMKDEMDRTMERIECVEYRFTERTADLEENLENCVTKISKIEKQQQEQQQPMETFMDGKILLSKFLGFIINICVVVIIVVAFFTKLIMPLIANRVRLVATCVALSSVILLWKYSEHEWFNMFRNSSKPDTIDS